MKKRILLLALISATTLSCKKETNPEVVANKDETPVETLVSGNKRFLDEKLIHPHQSKKNNFRKPK
jgi:carbonic anhydrase